MWQVLKTTLKRSGFSGFEVPYIQREDGFSLTRIGMWREQQEVFAAKGGFGEFRFIAHRWDITKNKPTDEYIVYMDLCPSDWPLDAKRNIELIKAHSIDIESALLHYPPHRMFDFKPVAKIWFKLGPNTPLIRAEEI